jgi:photosystem I subunit 3
MKVKFLKIVLTMIFLSIIGFLSEASSNLNIVNATTETIGNYSSLTPCKESKSFQNRSNTALKKLENRLKYYTPESKEREFLLKEIESTKGRFERYRNSNFLCGKEGVPHIIANGDWNYANEFVVPGILFIYTTGWIGWVGRKYLKYVTTTENTFENEIIINVPVALSIMTSGFLWPVDVWKEFLTNDLLASDAEITVSPR